MEKLKQCPRCGKKKNGAKFVIAGKWKAYDKRFNRPVQIIKTQEVCEDCGKELEAEKQNESKD